MSVLQFPRVLIWLVASLFLVAGSATCTQAAEEMKIRAVLVWATDDANPPAGKNYQPVAAEIRKRLRALKWKNYFEVKHIDFTASSLSHKSVPVSDKCSLDVRALGNSQVEVTLIGKGKVVGTVKGALPKNEILVPGGDAPNDTAWLVILKRLD
ncbi:MAG TPA: hypothetical protein VNZ64_16605 [Candidatus Acidoferrum sp.]|jgi:hypothetical protein|nr:hypothetical protein [Candidatus Acidoferrum sp.]